MSNYHYEFIKQQVDGLQYISQFVKLRKVGMIYKAVCPFHNEKTPSMTIYPKGTPIKNKRNEKQEYASFYCFGCGAGGDVITFKQLKDGYETRLEACEALEKEMGFNLEDEEIQQNYLQEQLNKIKKSYGNILSLSEINLICSSICRNYLLWIKEHYNKYWKEEVQTIEKFYRYFDQTLLDRNAIEAMDLITEVTNKIDKRRILIKEKMNSSVIE